MKIHIPERCGLLVGLLFGTRLLFGPNPPGCCVWPNRGAPEVVEGEALPVLDDIVGFASSLPPSGLFLRPVGVVAVSPENLKKSVNIVRIDKSRVFFNIGSHIKYNIPHKIAWEYANIHYHSSAAIWRGMVDTVVMRKKMRHFLILHRLKKRWEIVSLSLVWMNWFPILQHWFF